MATPNVVPRSDGEATIGKTSVKWLKMYTTTGFQVGADGAANTVQMTNIDSAGGTQGNILWEGSGVDAHETSLVAINATANRILSLPDLTCTLACVSGSGSSTQAIIIAFSDETSLLTVGDDKIRFTMPYAFTLQEIKASVNTAPTGAALTIQVTEAGAGNNLTSAAVSIAATATIGATTSFSDSSLAEDAIIGINIDQVGSTLAGKGLKVTLIGYIT